MPTDDSTLADVIAFFKANPTSNALGCAEGLCIPWKVAARLEAIARPRLARENVAARAAAAEPADGEGTMLTRAQVRAFRVKGLRERARELRERAAKLEQEAKELKDQ